MDFFKSFSIEGASDKEILNSHNSCEPQRFSFQNDMSKDEHLNHSTFHPFNFITPHHSRFTSKKAAFTLAEVLITLGIIGIVAAMTLPALVTNNRNKQLEAALKKDYSVISQAFDMYNAKVGERITPSTISGGTLKTKILPYFKIARDCGKGSETTAAQLEKTCIPNYINTGSTEKNSTTYKNFTGKNYMSLGKFDDGQFVLADGALVLLENNTPGQLFISVDVNGYGKLPNRLGQDLFMFEIDEKGALRPMGSAGTYYYDEADEYCSKTSSDPMNGAGCTYKALNEKDYFNKLPK